MDDIVIVSAARTPVGSFSGAFASVPAHVLGTAAIEAAISRAGIQAADVDEVILGAVAVDYIAAGQITAGHALAEGPADDLTRLEENAGAPDFGRRGEACERPGLPGGGRRVHR